VFFYERKYRLTNEEKLLADGKIVHRIEALFDFGDVKKGQLGGFIECEENLSHFGSCWVYDEAVVCERASVQDSARVRGTAYMGGRSVLKDHAILASDARMVKHASLGGHSKIMRFATIAYGSFPDLVIGA
jgi:hypothetical protein